MANRDDGRGYGGDRWRRNEAGRFNSDQARYGEDEP